MLVDDVFNRSIENGSLSKHNAGWVSWRCISLRPLNFTAPKDHVGMRGKREKATQEYIFFFIFHCKILSEFATHISHTCLTYIDSYYLSPIRWLILLVSISFLLFPSRSAVSFLFFLQFSFLFFHLLSSFSYFFYLLSSYTTLASTSLVFSFTIKYFLLRTRHSTLASAQRDSLKK